MDTLRKQLVNDVNSFNWYLGNHVWQINNDENKRYKMKSPEEFRNDQEYQKERMKINDLSTRVCDTYDELVKMASKKGF